MEMTAFRGFAFGTKFESGASTTRGRATHGREPSFASDRKVRDPEMTDTKDSRMRMQDAGFPETEEATS